MNISRKKLKEVIKEELDVLLGLTPPVPLGVDIGSNEPEPIVILNENLLRAAEIAENNSFMVTENLKEIISMLKEEKTNKVKTKVINAIDSISNIVNELNKFHDNEQEI